MTNSCAICIGPASLHNPNRIITSNYCVLGIQQSLLYPQDTVVGYYYTVRIMQTCVINNGVL